MHLCSPAHLADDTDTQSSSSSLCNVSTDKNVNACSMEPLVEKRMLRDIKRELAKDQNNDLIEGYRTCGISNDGVALRKINHKRSTVPTIALRLKFPGYILIQSHVNAVCVCVY